MSTWIRTFTKTCPTYEIARAEADVAALSLRLNPADVKTRVRKRGPKRFDALVWRHEPVTQTAQRVTSPAPRLRNPMLGLLLALAAVHGGGR